MKSKNPYLRFPKIGENLLSSPHPLHILIYERFFTAVVEKIPPKIWISRKKLSIILEHIRNLYFSRTIMMSAIPLNILLQEPQPVNSMK